MKKYIYLFLLLLAFVSCNKRKQGIESPPKILNEIFVVDSLQNKAPEFLLSDIASDIEIIPLETNEKSALKFLTNLQIGANDLFINSRIAVLRFDINGKFLHKIGSMG
ncbi:6-bladed beta-propeller, partial [Macellibacteroides fermentans]|uniref:6-bladed beta-propeller n=1 Tax=Macellibacteroides fermentans TaxID=879969 RepID=UPI00406D30FD